MREIMRYKRGMVFWIDDKYDKEKNNNIVKGVNRDFRSSVMAGTRPWVVISCDESNEMSSIVNVVPITSSKDPSENVPYHVQFLYRGEHYTVLAEQIKTVDNFCVGTYLYTLSDRLMEKIESVMMAQYGIRQKLSCTEETLEEVIKLIQPTIKKVIVEKASVCNHVYSVKNIEDIALKIGQDIEDLFTDGNTYIEPTVENIVVNEKTEEKKEIENIIVEDKKEEIEEENFVLNSEEDQQDQEIEDQGDIPENLEDQKILSAEELEKEIKKINSKSGNNGKTGKSKKGDKSDRNIRKEKGQKWSMEEKLEFYSDCEKMEIPEIMKKWGMTSKGTYYSTKYVIKKELRLLEEKKKLEGTAK